MISLPAGSRIWLVAGITDMRNGFNGLASRVQNTLRMTRSAGICSSSGASRRHDKGTVGRPGRPVHVYQRLERGRFVWPVTRDGKIHLTPAQLSMLLEGINWKHPQRTERPGIRI